MKNLEHLHVPKYVQLMMKLREQIESNVLKAGDSLPTRERLMKENNLSLSTVTRAITELERQGWLISRQGSGTFVVKRNHNDGEMEPDPRLVGLLLPTSNLQSYTLAQELAIESKDYDMKIITMFSPEDEEVELNYSRYLFEIKVKALIWSPVWPKRHIGVASYFAKHKIPVILCEKVNDHLGPNCYSITTDHFGGIHSALQHLLELGHRRIAYVGPRSSDSDFGPIPERWSAYKDTMKEHNLWDPEELVINSSIFQEWHHYSDHIRSLFNKSKPPTAIVGYDDTIALDAARCLISLGYRIPEEISIVGNGDYQASRYSFPRLTTISMCQAEYVDTIMRNLHNLFLNNGSSEIAPVTVVSQRLILRESAMAVADMSRTN